MKYKCVIFREKKKNNKKKTFPHRAETPGLKPTMEDVWMLPVKCKLNNYLIYIFKMFSFSNISNPCPYRLSKKRDPSWWFP